MPRLPLHEQDHAHGNAQAPPPGGRTSRNVSFAPEGGAPPTDYGGGGRAGGMRPPDNGVFPGGSRGGGGGGGGGMDGAVTVRGQRADVHKSMDAAGSQTHRGAPPRGQRPASAQDVWHGSGGGGEAPASGRRPERGAPAGDDARAQYAAELKEQMRADGARKAAAKQAKRREEREDEIEWNAAMGNGNGAPSRAGRQGVALDRRQPGAEPAQGQWGPAQGQQGWGSRASGQGPPQGPQQGHGGWHNGGVQSGAVGGGGGGSGDGGGGGSGDARAQYAAELKEQMRADEARKAAAKQAKRREDERERNAAPLNGNGGHPGGGRGHIQREGNGGPPGYVASSGPPMRRGPLGGPVSAFGPSVLFFPALVELGTSTRASSHEAAGRVFNSPLMRACLECFAPHRAAPRCALPRSVAAGRQTKEPATRWGTLRTPHRSEGWATTPRRSSRSTAARLPPLVPNSRTQTYTYIVHTCAPTHTASCQP